MILTLILILIITIPTMLMIYVCVDMRGQEDGSETTWYCRVLAQRHKDPITGASPPHPTHTHTSATRTPSQARPPLPPSLAPTGDPPPPSPLHTLSSATRTP